MFYLLVVILMFNDNIWAQNPIDPCPQLPPHVPNDINDLSPSNIKVVMALGDSITAAFGALGREGYLDEFRGISGPIGLDPEAITLASFLRHYSPNIFGGSTGSHFVELPGEGFYENDFANAAQSAATTNDFTYQISHIVDVLNSNPNISMKNDWKFINILIGANDACPLCWDFDRPDPQEAGDDFESNMESAIQQIYKYIPRTLVNILPLFNFSGVYNLSLDTNYCSDFHDVVPFECPCAFDSDQANRNYLDSVITEYGHRVVKLTKFWNAKNLPEFNVVYQPFTRGLQIADLPLDYLSDLDCFHPSLLAHQMIAIAGWNSLIVPFKQKSTTFDPSVPLKCADSTSRLFTS